MPIKISVIIPTYRRPHLLIRCLTALCNQEMEKSAFEVIVVSDGPDEKTAIILNDWINKKEINLTFLNTETKKGPAGARNYGWLQAKASLIAFTDDDCLPDKTWLKSFLNFYRDEEAIAFTGRTIVPVDENPSDFAANTAQLEKAEFITANCACTKKALIYAGGFDERFKLAWREDSDLQFKFSILKIPVIRISDAVVVHPVREEKWGISIWEQKKGFYDALLYKKYPQLYKSKLNAAPLLNYYITVFLWLLLFVLSYFKEFNIVAIAVFILAALIGNFTYKRLKNTRKSLNDVIEMLVTSIIIPFLSVYWRIYGAIKFRVFFI